MEKQQWALWKQSQTKKQLATMKLDVQSPIKSEVCSQDILQTNTERN